MVIATCFKLSEHVSSVDVNFIDHISGSEVINHSEAATHLSYSQSALVTGRSTPKIKAG